MRHFHLLHIRLMNAAQTNHVELIPNGLAGIPVGLKKLERDEVSGVKLVVKPFETP